MRKRAFFRLPRSLFLSAAATLCLGLPPALLASCYATDRGVAPPEKAPYFPIGLATSPGGKVLYVANSDFDIQYEAGTLESYDLTKIRQDALLIRNDPRALLSRCPSLLVEECPYVTLPREDEPRCADAPGDTRTTPPRPLGAVGTACTPPMKPGTYHRATVRIGAFATELQLSKAGFTRNGQPKRRLFAPLRGNASITWVDIADDARDPALDASYMDCGAERNEGTCDLLHQAGNRGTEPGNTRNLTMPGEPFGMGQSPDGAFLAVAHQSTGQASLFSSGLPALGQEASDATTPSLQFVTENVPIGGNGITAIPYDPDSYVNAAGAPRPAFLLTSRSAPELTLLRMYTDQGLDPAQGSSTLSRPYLVPEFRYPVNANPDGFDSREIVIDSSARGTCKRLVGAGATPEQLRACARLPLTVFIANRSPDSVLVAELGERTDLNDGSYASDSLRFIDAIPVPAGVSRLQLAPIVDRDGALALRLFAVCFDSSAVVVIDPETRQLERILRVGRGPAALAFDPFDMAAAIRHDVVPRDENGDLTYRFGYLASFTESFIQVIDLDRSDPTSPTFEKVVFTLGDPTAPKSEQD